MITMIITAITMKTVKTAIKILIVSGPEISSSHPVGYD